MTWWHWALMAIGLVGFAVALGRTLQAVDQTPQVPRLGPEDWAGEYFGANRW